MTADEKVALYKRISEGMSTWRDAQAVTDWVLAEQLHAYEAGRDEGNASPWPVVLLFTWAGFAAGAGFVYWVAL